MASEPLTKDSDFVVKESVAMDLVIAGIFYLMGISALIYDVNVPYSQTGAYYKSIYITFIPAILFTRKAIQNKTSYTINKKGIYFYQLKNNNKVIQTGKIIID